MGYLVALQYANRGSSATITPRGIGERIEALAA
jgi:hypothetical protein